LIPTFKFVSCTKITKANFILQRGLKPRLIRQPKKFSMIKKLLFFICSDTIYCRLKNNHQPTVSTYAGNGSRARLTAVPGKPLFRHRWGWRSIRQITFMWADSRNNLIRKLLRDGTVLHSPAAEGRSADGKEIRHHFSSDRYCSWRPMEWFMLPIR